MVKRILSVIALAAILFSVKADLMLYSFNGNITNINLESVDISLNYNILMDFDAPAEVAGSEKIDGNYGGYNYDYASAIFDASSDILFPSENLIYTTKEAYHMSYQWYGSDFYENVVLIENQIVDGYNYNLLNQFSLYNSSSSSFQIGDVFTLSETKNTGTFFDHQFATGYATLTSISAFEIPETSVPEASFWAMIILSLCMLFSFSKMKLIKIKA